MNLRARLVEALALLLAVAVVARVVFGLLGPLLPSLLILIAFAGLLLWLLRGPHGR